MITDDMRAAAPRSTYRLQFHAGFTFKDARAITDYLSRLGISHAYASPYLKAKDGSTHGYDVTDHSIVNPELGGESARAEWVDSLRAHDMSHILDIVPNHMGIATNDNDWWNHVLEYGPSSPFAGYFDIHWNGTHSAPMKTKVVLPMLGAPYGKSLKDGALSVEVDRGGGRFVLVLGERRLPIAPHTFAQIMPELDGIEMFGADQSFREVGKALKATLARRSAAESGFALRMEQAAAETCEPQRLHDLLEAQFYRLAHWQAANGTINYRRFFDVGELAALKMEREEVFAAAHRRILEWVHNGSVAGLRIDHPDGLADPDAYLRRLQQAAGRPLYVVVEKILGEGEALRPNWATSGTSGYEFLSKVNGLFVDGKNDAAMQLVYERFVGAPVDYATLVRKNKRRISDEVMASELNFLAESLYHIAQRDLYTRDFGFVHLRFALREMSACFPIYRTYITKSGASDEDKKALDVAIAMVRKQRPRPSDATLDLVRSTLLSEDADGCLFAQRFQQFTAPVMAKGVEDTTFYQFNRLLSVNEVGCDPAAFGTTTDQLHEFFEHRQQHWPTGISALSTHDTKRSEDVRARLNVLSEIPDEWGSRVQQWAALNECHRGECFDDRNVEYALYQSLLGAWPARGSSEAFVDPIFVKRISDVILKMIREAKQRTSWSDPDLSFEAAVDDFVHRILDPETATEFLQDFCPFQRRVARAGFVNSISQTILKLTAPGVPDTYQGTEIMDFSLVDPDNRRPVDFEYRRALLNYRELPHADETNLAFVSDLAKSLLHTTLLNLRMQHPELFLFGEYSRETIDAPQGNRLFAFTRRWKRDQLVVRVPVFSGIAVIEEKNFCPVRAAVCDESSQRSPFGVDLLRNIGFHRLPLSPLSSAVLFLESMP